MEPAPTEQPRATDSRSVYALIVAVIGLAIPAVLIGLLAHYNVVHNETEKLLWEPSEITSVAGLFTSIVGTLVGAFLGVQVGSAGKEQAETRATVAEQKAARAEAWSQKTLISMLPPEQAQKLTAL